MATRNNSIMSEIGNCRVYNRNGKYFVSEVKDNKLRRLRITPNTATLLTAVPSEYKCKTLIDEAEKIGSSDYYATNIQ